MIDDALIVKERIPIQPLEAAMEAEEIEASLSKIEGIENLSIENGAVEISYYPQIVSLHIIRTEIIKAGIILTDTRKSKGVVGRFIDRLAESNKKNFGSKPLDCCDLNNKKSGSSSD